MAKKDKGSDAGAAAESGTPSIIVQPPLLESTGKLFAPTAYRVLARKYRPQNFEDAFIGQSAMVRMSSSLQCAGCV